MRAFISALIVCAFALAVPAQAAHHNRHQHHRHYVAQGDIRHAQNYQPSAWSGSATILPHPQGCPRTAFCGCGVAVRVFGVPIRSLWSVDNWRKFPSSSPQPGMVAVWPHHVAYIEQIIGNGLAMMFDPNSGHHETKEHVRSLRGAKIVDPHHSNIAWLTESDDSKPTRHHATRYAKHRRLVLR